VANRGRNSRVAAGMRDVLQALAAYTERHYRRVEELADESYLVEWVLGEMDGGVALGGLELGDGVNGESEKDTVMLGA
jgi:U3 small nucleolar RNA-associated protein 13